MDVGKRSETEHRTEDNMIKTILIILGAILILTIGVPAYLPVSSCQSVWTTPKVERNADTLSVQHITEPKLERLFVKARDSPVLSQSYLDCKTHIEISATDRI
jgi:hypothetical protein